MNSMTGYGKAVVERNGKSLTIELKSVNHRFLDISTKIPRAFIAHEDVIRSGLSKALTRGHIDVFVTYTRSGETDKQVTVDMSLAKGYVEAAQALTEAFPQLNCDFNVNALMRSGDVLSLTQTEDDADQIRQMLVEAVDGAAEQRSSLIKCAQQRAMRCAEICLQKSIISRRCCNASKPLRRKL